MSTPCLHSASVATRVPSTSRIASVKNAEGCWAPTRSRVSLRASIKVTTSDSAKRRQMAFEEMEVVVDVVDQADPARQEEHGADAACGEALDALGQLIVDVGGGHHGLIAFRSGPIEDAFEDPPLAVAEDPAVAFSRHL